MNALVRQITEARERLAPLTGDAFSQELNRLFSGLFGAPIVALSGSIVDAAGVSTNPFGSVVCSTFTQAASSTPIKVNADIAGCVVATADTMDLEQFRAAYANIVAAKQFRKTPIPRVEGVLQTGITLGVICAKNCAVPLEELAEELSRLNEQTSSDFWPDMVSVLSQGIINYGVQFPTQKLSGDFLPPAEGALKNYVPPIFVVIVMKPTGEFTLHHMTAFITAHMRLYAPGAQVPDDVVMRAGTSKTAMTMTGYQYNLAGQLCPVARENYNDRYLPPRPMIIHDPKGKPMGGIQFMPWQDGGVVMLFGSKLPLEGLLIFAGREALTGGIIPLNGREVQLSHVIPMNEASFNTFLSTIQRQSNMTVRPDTSQIIMQKVADEGTGSPFMARLFLGPLTLRDTIFEVKEKRDAFDKAFQGTLMNIMNLRTTAQDLIKLFNGHATKVASGQIARIAGNSIQIDESVSWELKKHTQDFLNGGVRVVKDGIQNITKNFLQINIGFLFQKHASFERGIEALRATDPALADYLLQTRQMWSERLVEDARNAMEHEGWQLPDVAYGIEGSVIKVGEPEILGQPITEFVEFMLDRILCFVEEIIAHSMQRKLPSGISFTEVPLAERCEVPLRFKNALTGTGSPIWQLTYHASNFEES